MPADGSLGWNMLWFPIVAIAVGLVIGRVLGGRVHFIADKHVRWPLLLFLGLALQVIVELDGVPIPFALLILSYVYLIIFCLANLRLVGMGLICIGIALNALAIALNHGMPVREEAIRAAGFSGQQRELTIHEVKHRLETPDTKLAFLGDIIPVRPMHTVVSFGDLILSVGIADLIANLMRAPRRRSQADEESGEQDETIEADLEPVPLEPEPEPLDITASDDDEDAEIIDLRDPRSPEEVP